LLHKEGFEDVTVCSDGVELIESFKGRNFPIVVTDQHMPNMDGVTAIGILKETFRFKAILLTADVSFEKPAWIDRLLNKPTNGKELKRAILEQHLGLETAN
jgi:CheY-like chemotaxis protein